MACRWHTGRIMWEREVELGVGWSKGSESFVDAVCRCREWEECGWDVTWMTPGRKIQRRRWMYGGGKQKVVELKDTFSCQRAADDAESWGKWAKPNLRRDRQRTTGKTERDKERKATLKSEICSQQASSSELTSFYSDSAEGQAPPAGLKKYILIYTRYTL